jgi:hypothetical protein
MNQSSNRNILQEGLVEEERENLSYREKERICKS